MVSYFQFIFRFSLYPWALLQPLGTGPGIHWDPIDKQGNERSFFVKKTLLPGSSLAELRYLMFLSHTDERFKNECGEPYQIEHAYHRGQKFIAGYKVDGYVETPQKTFIVEFNGCYFHKPCPHSGCKFNEGYYHVDRQDYDWYKKELALKEWCDSNNGELIVKWECQFKPEDFRSLETSCLPRIMKPFESKTPDHISHLVLTGELFGFVECSLKSPDWLIQKFSQLNFPPIIRRENVTLDMLGEFMQKRILALERKVPVNGIPTVVNAWHADKIMLFTPLLKWYLELGIEMTDVMDVVQYQEKKCFTRFISGCVKGRIEATAAGKPTAAQTFKIAMNSR